MDFSNYKTIEEIAEDIKTVKIQGATNVALATLRGMEIASEQVVQVDEEGINKIINAGQLLSQVRVNEPLAENGVKYIQLMLKQNFSSFTDTNTLRLQVSQLVSNFLNFVQESKRQMIAHADELPSNVLSVFTHCHSSTVEKILLHFHQKNPAFKIFCTETRPLMQGRITAKHMVEAGVDTTLLVDSAAESVIVQNKIDIVFIGADEITLEGDAVNKIGSFGIALASYYAQKPLYVVTPLLKVNPLAKSENIEIEHRSKEEVWTDAPEGLKIYNPAFEIIPKRLITGYITEVGVVKPEDLITKLRETYPWVF